MTADLSRLFRPKSVAVIGGGAWCASVIDQLVKAGFQGDIWPVHPSKERLGGFAVHARVDDLPRAPDATFVGINSQATVDVVAQLSARGAGGAVCFASGFGEVAEGQSLNQQLLEAAGDMPILGPNCYGMINALDGAMLWPDQHGCVPVDSGVAILTQSSNIAINLTMQTRGLPLAYVVTCGNQAQMSEAAIATSLLDDPRVTAIGMHIEGFSDLSEWQTLARKARDKGVPLVALKAGKSSAAQLATVSHTASIAGSAAGATALLEHLGIAQVDDLPTLLETLKILHVAGPLDGLQIASISCSGGEASLIADLAEDTPLSFPRLTPGQTDRLAAVLGPKVTLANPLDYHTYIWRDDAAMTQAFSAMIEPDLALTLLIVDFPRGDRCDLSDWDCAINAAIGAKEATGGTFAMVATLPELMPEDVAQRLMAGGIIPLAGLREALAAVVAAQRRSGAQADLCVPQPARDADVIPEAEAKSAMAACGLEVPWLISGSLDDLVNAAKDRPGPFVLKATGLAHKSDSGGVALSLRTAQDIRDAAQDMPCDRFILEDMIEGAVAELLVGVVKDPAHGFVITLAAGGVLTELLQDRASCLFPADRTRLEQTLNQLNIAPVLRGYRGRPGANIDCILAAIEAIQAYVLANLSTVEEIEINPLIVTPDRVVAADALIRKSHD
ncbi:acetate--CoA ligase family protein [Thalassorhabdomicrobium marinisediminis]|uniref:Acyl-CoA synthetase n=1 Tax=Thalassorhabdomicrobium marinisediminis TaxID=2170577 RepID=A0A2T7FZZ5_9RHOB|nr:acetate--CoA ligase family protein [Thalassorhabdomicrobium marinisediminis]PVA07752.1 acyl-CoA synthetase [Thalassorhabdomicrobium marinisediminis]